MDFYLKMYIFKLFLCVCGNVGTECRVESFFSPANQRNLEIHLSADSLEVFLDGSLHNSTFHLSVMLQSSVDRRKNVVQFTTQSTIVIVSFLKEFGGCIFA